MVPVTAKVGPYGVTLAIVAPPYEFLGEFLTAEGSSLDSWACDDLLLAAYAIKNGEKSRYARSGNAHSVHITSQKATITSEYRIPPAQRVISLDNFLSVLTQWQSLLRQICR